MITLRHFNGNDTESIKKNIYPDMTLSEIRNMILEWNKNVYDGKFFEMIAIASGDTIVGYCSIVGQSKSIVSLGTEVYSGYQGEGIATEAVAALIKYASTKGYKLVMDQVRADNDASIKLHEKLGFETDGYIYKNQKNHDVVIYIKQI